MRRKSAPTRPAHEVSNMKTYRIYLFRPGLSPGNFNAQYIGSTDEPLDPRGAAQLQKLAGAHPYPKVEAVFTSPLRRARQSAAILYPDMHAAALDGFKECDFGDFEGKTAGELQNDPDFSAWLSGDLRARPPHGESGAEFTARVADAFEKLVDAMLKTGVGSAAIVAHSGVLMTILACYGLPEAPSAQWQMDPGYGFELAVEPALWMRAKKIEVRDTAPVPHIFPASEDGEENGAGQ